MPRVQIWPCGTWVAEFIQKELRSPHWPALLYAPWLQLLTRTSDRPRPPRQPISKQALQTNESMRDWSCSRPKGTSTQRPYWLPCSVHLSPQQTMNLRLWSYRSMHIDSRTHWEGSDHKRVFKVLSTARLKNGLCTDWTELHSCQESQPVIMRVLSNIELTIAPETHRRLNTLIHAHETVLRPGVLSAGALHTCHRGPLKIQRKLQTVSPYDFINSSVL